jgi:hypothetical protein
VSNKDSNQAVNQPTSEAETQNYLLYLLNNPLRIKDFVPMKRAEIYSKE